MGRKQKGERNCEQNILNFSLQTRLKTQSSWGPCQLVWENLRVSLMMNCWVVCLAAKE